MVDEIAAGEALLAAGDARGALAHVRRCLAWPRGREVGELPRWLRLLHEVSVALSLGELVEVAEDAVRDPDSPDKLYDLGYALIDAGAPSIAASVLWHCLKLVGESEEVVCELVSALESALAYRDAYVILEQHAELRSRSFLCEYLFAFNAAMSGKLDTMRAVYGRLVPESPEMDSMLDTIKGIVDRADKIEPRDERDLRGWQYVLTGTLLAHQSPYGFDEPMHGRYAMLQDSIERIKTGLDRVVPLARAIAAPCVYALADRASEIVAGALATLLELPLAPWPAIGIPDGVIVAYDLATIPGDALVRLSQRKAGQLFFAHATPWTRDSAVAPDVTTLLYETIIEPWGARMIVDPESSQVSQGEPDARAVDAIAAEIVASPGLDAEERACDEPEHWELLARTAWPALPGQRSRFWAGGPVPSNRFDPA